MKRILTFLILAVIFSAVSGEEGSAAISANDRTTKKYEEALNFNAEIYKDTKKNSAIRANAYLRAIQIYRENLNAPEKGILLAEEALSLNGISPETQAVLMDMKARCFILQKKYKQAIQEWQKISRITGNISSWRKSNAYHNIVELFKNVLQNPYSAREFLLQGQKEMPENKELIRMEEELEKYIKKFEENPTIKMKPLTDHIVSPREKLNLCGEWEFCALKAEEKPEKNTDWQKTILPQRMFFNEKESRWFRRNFSVSQKQLTQKIELCFELVSDVCEVSINGKKIGRNEDFLLPFRFDISSFVKEGENEITVRITNELKKINWMERPMTHDWAISEQFGIFRPVHLEFSDKLHIRDVKIETHLSPLKELSAVVVLQNESTKDKIVELNAQVNGEWSCRSGNVKIPAGGTKTISLTKEWKNAKLWSPATPHLYFLDLSLSENGKKMDAFRERFGFREIRIEKNRILLNGYPFLNRRHSMGGYQSDEQYKKMIARSKERGFIGARISLQDFSRQVRACDETGFLCSTLSGLGWGAGVKKEEFWPRAKIHTERTIRQYKNHPSLIFWGVSNEFGTVYGGCGKEKISTPRQWELGKIAESLDQTRFWTAHGEIELGLPVFGNPGPAPVRSFHYPMPTCNSGNELPELAYWYSKGLLSWQGISTPNKPLMISEDLFHGMTDQFFGMSKWAGDSIYSTEGYNQAWFDAILMLAEGYYYTGLGTWNPWDVAADREVNDMFIGRGPIMPDYLIWMREHAKNIRAGETVNRSLFVCNQLFENLKCRLDRVDILNGKEIGKNSKAISLPPGSVYKEKISLTVPETKIPGTYRIYYTLSSQGKILTSRNFNFFVYPEEKQLEMPKETVLLSGEKSLLRRFHFPEGSTDSCEEALKKNPTLIVVDRDLSREEGERLNDFVIKGGKVLLIDVGSESWAPLPLEFRKPQSYVWRRNDTALPDLKEESLRSWLPDGLLGSSSYPKNENESDLSILLDSGHRDGVTNANLLWLFRGKGGWLLCQLPVSKRLDTEPVAGFVLQKVLLEAGKNIAPSGKTVSVVSGPYQKLFKNNRFLTAEKPEKADVLIFDGSVKLEEATLQEIKNLANSGKTIWLVEPREENEKFLQELGVKWSPSRAEWVLRKHNSGLLAGLSNDNLHYSPVEMYLYHRIMNYHYYHHLDWTLKKPSLTGALEKLPQSNAEILTTPGAIAEIPFGKGKIIITTIKWSSLEKMYPQKTLFTLRTLLGNLGIRTSDKISTGEYFPVSLKSAANRNFWENPDSKKKKMGKYAPGWFRNGNDMRYFPVNLCGWSKTANNFCPVEPFPQNTLNFAGIKFQLLDPDQNRGSSVLVLNPGETIGIQCSGLIKRVWFLGACEKTLPAGTPLLEMRLEPEGTTDWRSKAVIFKAGEHLDIYRWAVKVKSGIIGWQGDSQLDPGAALYCWAGENPHDPKKNITYMNLKNVSDSAVAIVAVSAQK